MVEQVIPRSRYKTFVNNGPFIYMNHESPYFQPALELAMLLSYDKDAPATTSTLCCDLGVMPATLMEHIRRAADLGITILRTNEEDGRSYWMDPRCRARAERVLAAYFEQVYGPDGFPEGEPRTEAEIALCRYIPKVYRKKSRSVKEGNHG